MYFINIKIFLSVCNAQYSITDRSGSLVRQMYQHSSSSVISSTTAKQERSQVAQGTACKCLIKPRLFYRDANPRTLKGKTNKVAVTFHRIVLVPFFFVAR